MRKSVYLYILYLSFNKYDVVGGLAINGSTTSIFIEELRGCRVVWWVNKLKAKPRTILTKSTSQEPFFNLLLVLFFSFWSIIVQIISGKLESQGTLGPHIMIFHWFASEESKMFKRKFNIANSAIKLVSIYPNMGFNWPSFFSFHFDGTWAHHWKRNLNTCTHFSGIHIHLIHLL